MIWPMQIPTDGGPVYVETNLTAVIAEPWNAISSLAIALPGIYWALKLDWQVRRFAFIYYCCVLLILGGLGSTFYHAFRASQAMLVLDVLPALVLTISIGIHFWFRVTGSWWKVILVMVPLTLLRFGLHEWLPDHLATNLNYFVAGALIFLPILIYLARHQFMYWQEIGLSILFLSISLVMRDLDHSLADFLPMGSHFLWHIFSGVGAYYLGAFFYHLYLRDTRSVPA